MNIKVSEEDMREVVRMSMAQMAWQIAQMAKSYAVTIDPRVSASQALEAFGDAIISTNEKRFGVTGEPE